MERIEGNTSTELVKKAFDYVKSNGSDESVYGGTIPKDYLSEKSPNDFIRPMVECRYPAIFVLKDPKARWTDIAMQWVGITLRETEDCLQGFNDGFVTKYSRLYRRWLNDKGYFNYTYGERFNYYPYNLNQKSGNDNGGWEYPSLDNAIELLKKHPTTRRAQISTWYPPKDVGNPYCPCNMVHTLRIREGKLDWIVYNRSLDVLRGFSENIFMFTVFQELSAMKLGIPVGEYITISSNAHLYPDMLDYFDTNTYEEECYSNIAYPVKSFKTDFPSINFRVIDEFLMGKNFDKAIELTKSMIKDEYWFNWKMSLISDYARICGFKAIGMKALDYVSNEFYTSVERRM